MPSWIIITIMSLLRAGYIALFGGLVTWGALGLFDLPTIGFGYIYLIWLVPSFIISCIKITRLFKE
jgi:hypothetical protein